MLSAFSLEILLKIYHEYIYIGHCYRSCEITRPSSVIHMLKQLCVDLNWKVVWYSIKINYRFGQVEVPIQIVIST